AEEDEGGTPSGDSISTNLLSRLIEDGPSGLFFDAIGDNGQTPEQLRAALDAVDNVPGNVTLAATASGFVLDIRVVGTLDGMADLSVDGLNGALSMGGRMHIQADV